MTTNPTTLNLSVTDFTVAIDTREQCPWTFRGIKTDKSSGNLPLGVKTVRATLASGDYSIVGCGDEISVERKSKEDLFGTVASGRDRFASEHERLSSLDYACVIVECSLESALLNPPVYSQIDPKVIHRTWLSWEQKYGVPWHWCDCRSLAEVTCFRLLESFWKAKQRKAKEDETSQSVRLF